MTRVSKRRTASKRGRLLVGYPVALVACIGGPGGDAISAETGAITSELAPGQRRDYDVIFRRSGWNDGPPLEDASVQYVVTSVMPPDAPVFMTFRCYDDPPDNVIDLRDPPDLPGGGCFTSEGCVYLRRYSLGSDLRRVGGCLISLRSDEGAPPTVVEWSGEALLAFFPGDTDVDLELEVVER